MDRLRGLGVEVLPKYLPVEIHEAWEDATGHERLEESHGHA